MVRRFLLQCLVLSLPVLLLFGLVAWVDPYGYFGHGGPVPVALKEKNLYHDGRSMPFSNMLWKLVEFRRAPRTDVMLGDSRLSHFDMDALKRTSGVDYYNFGVPGGNYRTVDDLFTYADSLTTLRNVYVQVSFRGLKKGFDHDLFGEPRMLLEAPHLYVSNRGVLEATALNLYSWAFPDRVEYDRLAPDHWKVVLEMERAHVADFQVDTGHYERLERMARRCRERGAKLVFVEYPTHPDVQAIYASAGLGNMRQVYMDRLRTMAPVIDLDRPALFRSDRSFWRDPLHLTTEAQRELIGHVWGDAP